MKNLMFFHSGNGGGSSQPPVDPIQDLVDAFKAAVVAGGGTVGVNDAGLYTEIEDMITKGEINTAGTSLKSVQNIGLWGYDLVGSDITNFYNLVAPYAKIPTTVAEPILGAGKIEMCGAALAGSFFLELSYDKNSFYIEIDGHIQYVSATLGDVIRSITDGYRSRVTVGNVYNMQAPVSAATPSNAFLNERQSTRLDFDRTGDTLSVKFIQNGVTVYTFPDGTWANTANSADWNIKGTAGQLFDFWKIKTGLK